MLEFASTFQLIENNSEQIFTSSMFAVLAARYIMSWQERGAAEIVQP